ncbi:MAG: hypothetical protein V5A36_00130 [Natronomonas sp.]
MSFDTGQLDESNWRPRWTSTALAAVFGLAVTIGLAVSIDALESTLVALVSGLCLGGTIWSTAVTERRVATILAGVLATVSGLALLGALVVAAVIQLGWPPTPEFGRLAFAPFALVFAGFLSGFGALTALWGVTPANEAGTATVRLFVVQLVPAVALITVFVMPPLDPAIEMARFGIDLALARGAASDPIVVDGVVSPRFGGFFAVTAVAAFAFRTALGRLPLVEFAGEHSRETVEAVVGRIRGWLGVIFAVGGLLAIGGVVLQPVLPELYAYVSPGLLAVSIEITLSTTIRRALLAVALASAPAIVVPRLVRATASKRFRPNLLPLVPLAVGGAIVAVALGTHSTVEATALEQAGTGEGRRILEAVFAEFGSLALTLAVFVVGLSITTMLLLLVRFAGAFRFLGATMGVQSTSAGVFVAAAGAAIAGASVPTVLVGVAASLFVWDLGEFATTLAHEIGRAGDGLGSEFVHAVGGTVLAIGSVGVGLVTMRAIDAVPSVSNTIALLGTITVVVGTLLLFLVVR